MTYRFGTLLAVISTIEAKYNVKKYINYEH
jgi:hypothetical protein